MAPRRIARPRKRARKQWSQNVTQHSNALDLEGGVFTKRDPASIARSLKRSAERSRRRKSDPYRSAMSMLTFYVNRAGVQLSKAQRARLNKAKDELRRLYGRTSTSKTRR
jgi:Zn-dependent oligopeptidase